MKHPALPSCFVLLSLTGMGQVHVDRAVHLAGPAAGERRVEGLAPSLEAGVAVTAGIEQSGAVQYAGTVAGNTWIIDLPHFGTTPANGANVVLQVPATGQSPVFIILNSSPPLPVWYDGAPVNGGQLVEGSMLSVVLADGAYHILNGRSDLRLACPDGTRAVNDQYCIEPSERGTGNYFEAGLACAAAGLRLCSWAEYVAACQRTIQLQLTGMASGWEWTNSTSNEDNSARVAGAGSCESAGNWLSSGSAPVAFRCCFTR